MQDNDEGSGSERGVHGESDPLPPAQTVRGPGLPRPQDDGHITPHRHRAATQEQPSKILRNKLDSHIAKFC